MIKYINFKYSILISTSLLLLSGCGGSDKSTSKTTKTNSEVAVPSSNVRNDQSSNESESQPRLEEANVISGKSDPEGKPDDSNNNSSDSEKPKVVVIGIDDATIDWIKSMPARYYTDELKKQNPRDWYGFETEIRIQEGLNKIVQSPSVIIWDYAFLREGIGINRLSNLFNESPIPIVLPLDGDENLSDINNSIYNSASSSFNNNFFFGHATSYDHISHTSVDRWYPLDREEFMSITFRDDTREKDDIILPLSVAGFAVYLKQKMNLDKQQSLLYAESAGRCVSEKFDHKGKYFTGIKITKENVETISALDLIGSQKDEKQLKRMLANSIIVIGDTAPLYSKDQHLYADGKLYFGVYFHAWTAKKLLDRWEEIKKSDCFKDNISKD